MISGALEIIYGVDAGLVHPLLLPAAQGAEKFGYIVIAYEDSPDVFDIIFVRGGRVEEYAGLHHDLRTRLSEKSVQMALAACAMRCRVYLFSVSRQGFDRFLRTFHCVPSVNVAIDRLSRKQLSSLLTGIGCKNGILEVDRPSRPFPQIDLSRFYSVDELLKEAFRYRQGRMIVYDLELNEVIRQRLDIVIGDPHCDDRDVPEADSAETTRADTDGTIPGAVDEPVGAPPPGTPSPESPPDDPGGAGLVAAFRNALIDFQHAVTGVYGEKLDRRMNGVLSNFFPSPGAFDPGMVNLSNAELVLCVIEECVKRAWLSSRKKLRTKAKEIVRDLYDNNHGLLRKHGLDEKVRECYRRLAE